MFLLPESYWEVKQTKEKGRGIFAKKDIEAGVVIGDYLGKMIKPSEEDDYDKDEKFYSMYYSDHATIFPNLKKSGIHLLNHSCTPNTWMYTYKGHTLYFTLRHIFKGEELTIAYLLSPLDKYCKPCKHVCKCKSMICRETMHLSQKKYEKWSKFLEAQEKATKRERIRFGKQLPQLSSYPKSLPDDPIYDLFGAAYKIPQRLSDKKMPSVTTLRNLIREKGLTLQFPRLNMHVYGIMDNLVVSEVLL